MLGLRVAERGGAGGKRDVVGNVIGKARAEKGKVRTAGLLVSY